MPRSARQVSFADGAHKYCLHARSPNSESGKVLHHFAEVEDHLSIALKKMLVKFQDELDMLHSNALRQLCDKIASEEGSKASEVPLDPSALQCTFETLPPDAWDNSCAEGDIQL